MGALAIPVRPKAQLPSSILKPRYPEFASVHGSWIDLAAALVRPADDLQSRLYQHLLERTYVDAMGGA